jgi:large subunit ribosomal protein L10
VATEAKVRTIESLKARLSGTTAAVLTEYRGLTVQQLTDLRRQLRAASAEYKVVKNRLARRAVEGSPLAPLAPHLKGPTGMVLAGQDPVVVAKALQAFGKSNAVFQIKVGYIEGRLLQAADLKALADLPSRETLRAQVVGILQGPLAQLAGLLTGAHRQIVWALQQRGRGAE